MPMAQKRNETQRGIVSMRCHFDSGTLCVWLMINLRVVRVWRCQSMPRVTQWVWVC